MVSGYKIKFFATPQQKSPQITQASGQEAMLISQEVNKLIQKGAIKKIPFSKDGFLQPPVSCAQEGRSNTSCDRFEFSKQVHYKPTFPDGKPQFVIF